MSKNNSASSNNTGSSSANKGSNGSSGSTTYFGGGTTCIPRRSPKPSPSILPTRLVQSLFQRGEEPSPELYKHFRGHKDTITALNFHSYLAQIISGSKDGFVMCWNYQDENARVMRFEGHKQPVNDVTYNRDGDLMFSASDDATIRVWVPSYKGDTRVFRAHHSSVRSVACSPISDEFASASDDKTVKVWTVGHSRLLPSGISNSAQKVKVHSHSFLGSYSCHTNWVRSVRYHPDGKILCTSSDDGTICILDTRQKTKTMEIKVRGGTPNHAEFNPSAVSYIGATTSDSFHIYDVRNGKLVQIYKDIHIGPITKFTFHPSGDFAFTVSEDKRIKILDIVEGRPIFTLFGASDSVSTIASSKDGTLFATGGIDKNLLVWKPFLLPYTPKELERWESLEMESLKLTDDEVSPRGGSNEKENENGSATSATIQNENDNQNQSENSS